MVHPGDPGDEFDADQQPAREVIAGQLAVQQPGRPVRRRLDYASRRSAILASAIAAFGAAPYSQVSVRGIGRASGASEALIYKYFPDKAGLYCEVISQAIARLDAEMADRLGLLPSGTTAPNRLRAALQVYLDYIADNPLAWSEPLRGNAEPPLATQLRREARQRYAVWIGKQLGHLPGQRFAYATHCYLGFLDSACLRWLDRDCPDAERDPLIEAMLAGLYAAAGVPLSQD